MARNPCRIEVDFPPELDASVALLHSLAEPESRDQARCIMAALETQTALVTAIWWAGV